MTLERALAQSLKQKPVPAAKPAKSEKDKPAHLLLGERGEDMAVEFLLTQGFTVLQRNVRFKWGEIDIVAKQGNEIVFVEVRTRRIGKILPAACTVGPNKLGKLERCAETWAQERHYRGLMRIDLVAITIDRAGDAKIEHLKCITEAIS